MEIDDFEIELKEKVRTFFDKWRAENLEDPVSWPSEMGLADWYESFFMHTEEEK